MDFVGDEDATRYALEVALREHDRETQADGVVRESLPSARIARVFFGELNARGWKLAKDDVCVVCGNVLIPDDTEPHCEGCDLDGPRYTDPQEET
jgi:hypothetical protein